MMIGDKILGYTVDEKIGSGGFGTVYKVSKTNVSGTYIRALKHITLPSQKQYVDVLNSMGGNFAKADEYFAAALKEIVNEIRIISTLSETGTKNIVKYYENDIKESGSPKRYDIYILMEYLTPFTKYLYENEFKVKDVCKLGEDILNALIICHGKSIIHRDIKDDNIFVSNEGDYKLGDFGVSKKLNDKSKAESIKGTPNFIAPEVYIGREKYDDTVDVYSLGIVLYKLLNKSRVPFLPDFPKSYNSNDEDIAFDRRMKGEVPPLPYDANNILGSTIIKAICKRDERYNSAVEFLNALKSAMTQLSDEELNIVVNQVIEVPHSSDNTLGEITSPYNKSGNTGETIGSGFSTSGNIDVDNSQDKNLFASQSDLYRRLDNQNQDIARDDLQNNFDYENSSRSNSTNSVRNQNRDDFQNLQSLRQNTIRNVQNDDIDSVQVFERNDFNWINYALPVVTFLAFIIVYALVLPGLYGKGIGLGRIFFNNPDAILDNLQDEGKVFGTVYGLWAIKVLLYILFALFVASLFKLGHSLQNKKPVYNTNAIVYDKSPYLKAVEIYETAKGSNIAEASVAIKSIRNVMERLRNESDFGIGNNALISCETEIANYLADIEKNVDLLHDEKGVKAAADKIEKDCKNIQNKLRLRIEMKKK